MDNLLEELKKNVSGIIDTISEDNLDEVKEEVLRYFQLAEVMVDLIGGKKKPRTAVLNVPTMPLTEQILDASVSLVESPAAESVSELIEESVDFVVSEIVNKVYLAPEVFAAELKELTEKKEQPLAKDEVTKKHESNEAVLKQLAKSFEEEKIELGYPLSRNLYGGFLLTGSTTNSVYVPESAIRELDLADGDIVSAEVIPGGTNSKPFYKYCLERKGKPLKEAIRKEFQFGIVYYDEELKRFYVEKSVNGENLRIADSPTRFMISQEDVRQYNLKSDDIIDVAWYHNNFNKGRISWKYGVSELTESKSTTSKKILQRKTNETKTIKVKQTFAKTLEGKRICLVGVEPYHAQYKTLIESRGGELIAMTSQMSKISINAAIRKSDLVLVGISHTSHSASIYSNERAKHYSIPFKAFSGFGKETFLKTIEEVFTKTKK